MHFLNKTNHFMTRNQQVDKIFPIIQNNHLRSPLQEKKETYEGKYLKHLPEI